MAYHKPVLLKESIEGLNIVPKGIYVDLTFGGGGHSREVLKKLGKRGRLIAFDQDHDAEANIPEDQRISFVQANFRYLRNFLKYLRIESVQGILADLGISSHQIDMPERGFSFRAPGDLDMRMDRRSGFTAARLLEEYSEQELRMIFWHYGELKNSGRIASSIIKAREQGSIQTTEQLESVLKHLIPKNNPSKFLAKLYQALRMEINREADALKEMLPQALQYLSPGGRLVVITYHSIEDRIVKNFLRSGNIEGEIRKDFYGNVETPLKLINRNVITPTEKELEENKRARSAKLRIAEKV